MLKYTYDFVRRFKRFGSKLYRNLRSKLKGEQITFPTYCAVTSELEDAKIAKSWLRRKGDWYENTLPEKYRNAFAEWNHSLAAFPFMGGRVALSAAIDALDLKKGDEVIVPGYTCVVVPNAVKYAGMDIVYADIELETYGLSIEDVKKKLTSNTKAIVLHHLYGLVCRDYEELLSLAKKNNLCVIEDCTHATGAKYEGERIGNRGDVAFYSSEHSKVFTTVQGGIVTTNNPEIAKKLDNYWNEADYPSKDRIDQLLHTFILDHYKNAASNRWFWGDWFELLHGHKRIKSTTEAELIGQKPEHYGQKMPAPLASIGLSQLKKIDKCNNKRRQRAKDWDTWVEKKSFDKPLVIRNSEPIFLRYPVIVDPSMKKNREWALRDLDVKIGVWFKGHLHPVDGDVTNCPNASLAVNQCINLPTL